MSHPRSLQACLQGKNPLDSSAYLIRCSLYVLFRCGTRMGRTKLTVEQVLEARLRYASGEREYNKLAREFGVSREALQVQPRG